MVINWQRAAGTRVAQRRQQSLRKRDINISLPSLRDGSLSFKEFLLFEKVSSDLHVVTRSNVISRDERIAKAVRPKISRPRGYRVFFLLCNCCDSTYKSN